MRWRHEDLVHETSDFEVVGFAESQNPNMCKLTLSVLPILWVDELPPLAQSQHDLCAISTTHRFVFTGQVAEKRFQFPIIRYPYTTVLPSTMIGEDTILCLATMVRPNCKIGQHVIVN